MIRFSFLCAFLLLSLVSAHAQQSEIDRIRQMENERNSARKFALDRRLDSVELLMDREEYELADQKLKTILQSTKSVSSELTFYFGKNSYLLENYKQSIDWLNKYIQLKGTTGQFSAEAEDLLHKSEAGILSQRQLQSQQTAMVLSSNYTIDCGPTGKVACPVCKGTTVIVKRGYLGENYTTCPYCAKNGYLNCEDYNKLLRGELKASAR